MKKYPEVFFEKSGGDGPLFIYFKDGPYGNAIDDLSGLGAAFYDEKKQIIAVLFDRVDEIKDHQILKFKNNQSVEIKVKNGEVVQLTPVISAKKEKQASI